MSLDLKDMNPYTETPLKVLATVYLSYRWGKVENLDLTFLQ